MAGTRLRDEYKVLTEWLITDTGGCACWAWGQSRLRSRPCADGFGCGVRRFRHGPAGFATLARWLQASAPFPIAYALVRPERPGAPDWPPRGVMV